MLNAADQAFATVAAAEKVRAQIIKDVTLLENGSAFNAHSFGYARTLLRAAQEKPKPNGERLREYTDARLDSLKDQLLADERIFEDFEILKLADSLTLLANTYGADSDLVKQVLAGKSPRERAYELISGTKVRDPEFRKKLYEGGLAAIHAQVTMLGELGDLMQRNLGTTNSDAAAKRMEKISRVCFAMQSLIQQGLRDMNKIWLK